MSFLHPQWLSDKPHAKLASVISRHSTREAVSVRTTAEIRDAAKEALEAADWTIVDFVVAALRAVAAKPAQVLRMLAPYRPEPKPAGRPRKRQSDA
jgi:hypothetical protein